MPLNTVSTVFLQLSGITTFCNVTMIIKYYDIHHVNALLSSTLLLCQCIWTSNNKVTKLCFMICWPWTLPYNIDLQGWPRGIYMPWPNFMTLGVTLLENQLLIPLKSYPEREQKLYVNKRAHFFFGGGGANNYLICIHTTRLNMNSPMSKFPEPSKSQYLNNS